MKKIKTGSDFSGVGSFDQALSRLGFEQDKKFACDMDKYARITYIHNYGEPEYYPENVYDREIPEESLDIYMTSPPCQAFSLAGKRKGEDDDRGVLFYNSHEFIKKNNPRYFIFENVKGLLSDDGGKTFQKWVAYLGGKSVNGDPVIFPMEEAVPYHIYYKVLNARNYGVPQNRERIFIIGIRDDADNNFRFPKEEHLSLRLKDILQQDINDKYVLSDKLINGFKKHKDRHDNKGTGFSFKPKTGDDIANCLRANASICPTDNMVDLSKYYLSDKAIIKCLKSSANSNMDKKEIDDVSRCLIAQYYKIPFDGQYIKIKSATKKGYEEAEDGDSINLEFPDSKTRRGRVGKSVAQTLDTDDVIKELLQVELGEHIRMEKDLDRLVMGMLLLFLAARNDGSEMGTAQIDTKIRRLTPRECFRLMDFPEDFDFSVVSDTQAYKQAGNSIVVAVLEKIIKNLNL